MADTTDPDASASLAGATLGGKYRLLRLLGQGGMGEVYEATNINTGRRVAIKTLHAHLVRNAKMQQRFIQEARAATRIEHPNVIDVLDLDVDPELGIPYIVQEFLSGETLADRLDAAPAHRFSPDEAVRLAMPVMGALVAAHALGIVHRDLKPENIFLVRDRAGAEVPKVIDFGIAKVVASAEGMSSTRTGMMLGTPAYMSPEQAMGLTSTIDAQTDVWAMGVVLYEMLSGRLPYEAENANLLLGMIQYRDPVPLAERDASLPGDLVAVIDRALAKDRARRFATMQAFMGALLETSVWTGGALPSSPSTLPQPPPGVVAERPTSIHGGWTGSAGAVHGSRRALPWVVVIAMSLVALAAVASVALSPGTTARPPATAARGALAPTVTSTVAAIHAPPPAAPVAPPPVVPAENVAPPPPSLAPQVTPAVSTRPTRADEVLLRPAPPRPSRPPRRSPVHGNLNPDRDWQP